jgi:hypothetical protein
MPIEVWRNMIEALLEGGQIWSLLSIVAGCSAFLLGLYVYKKNPFMRISVFFFQLMIITLALGILDFFLMNAPDEGSARVIARTIFFLMVVMFAGYLYIASSFPFGSAPNWIHSNPRRYWAIMLLLALIPAATVDEMLRTSFGWGVPNSLSMYLLIGIVFCLVSISIFIMARNSKFSNNDDMKWQCFLMALAVMVPLIYGIGQEMLNYLGIVDNVPILSPGFVIANFIFAFGILKFNMFIISPVKEEVFKEPHGVMSEEIRISPSTIVLIEEKKAEVAYSIFLEELNDGFHGLLVSRTHPDTLREKYGLVKTPIIWLAQKAGSNHMEPSNLSILQHTITEFTKKIDRVVIMIDGLEYLISNNPVEKVLKFLYALRDEAADREIKILMPVDPAALDDRDLALFERECEVLQPDDENEKGKGRDRDLNSSQGIHSPTG